MVDNCPASCFETYWTVDENHQVNCEADEIYHKSVAGCVKGLCPTIKPSENCNLQWDVNVTKGFDGGVFKGVSFCRVYQNNDYLYGAFIERDMVCNTWRHYDFKVVRHEVFEVLSVHNNHLRFQQRMAKKLYINPEPRNGKEVVVSKMPYYLAAYICAGCEAAPAWSTANRAHGFVFRNENNLAYTDWYELECD